MKKYDLQWHYNILITRFGKIVFSSNYEKNPRLLHKVLVVLSGEQEIKSAHSLPALDARFTHPDG